ncbi:MAG: PIN domain-containing protein [Acidobacteriota bacterium]
MDTLVDTNILIYRYDAEAPHQQSVAHALLRQGLDQCSLVLAHQSIVEFVAVARRPRKRLDGATRPLLDPAELSREVEFMLNSFPILLPTQDTVRLALRGMSAYQLAWYDAHLWAYAEQNSIPEILSEDFQHGRWYGDVRVRNPFEERPEMVHQELAPYDADHRRRRHA